MASNDPLSKPSSFLCNILQQAFPLHNAQSNFDISLEIRIVPPPSGPIPNPLPTAETEQQPADGSCIFYRGRRLHETVRALPQTFPRIRKFLSNPVFLFYLFYCFFPSSMPIKWNLLYCVKINWSTVWKEKIKFKKIIFKLLNIFLFHCHTKKILLIKLKSPRKMFFK